MEALPLGLGVAVLLIYVNFATDTIRFPTLVSVALAFAIGPAAIGGMLEMYRTLGANHPAPVLQLAITFLVIGFSLLTLMLVVQQAIFIGFPQLSEESAAGYDVTWTGLNLVQLGIDVAFDIFYSLGLMLLGLCLARHPHYGKVTGYLGSFLGLALLVLNISTFPLPPANQGLIDVGPYTALWWLVVIAQGVWSERRDKKSGGAVPDGK